MDIIDFYALIGHAAYLDNIGKYAESDNMIKTAQNFGGMGGFGGFGGFGNNRGMGGGQGFSPGAAMVGGMLGSGVQGLFGRNPAGNLAGTIATMGAYDAYRKKENQFGKSRLELAQDKLKELVEQNAEKPSDKLKTEIENQKAIVQRLQALAPQPTLPAGQTAGQTNNPQAAGPSPGTPSTGQLNSEEMYKVVEMMQTVNTPQEFKVAIEKIRADKLSGAAENLAYRIYMMRQLQGGQQTAPAPAQQDLSPEALNSVTSLALTPGLTPQKAWEAITKNNTEIPAVMKNKAWQKYLELKQNPAYLTPPAAPQQAEVRTDVVNKALEAVNKAQAGRKIEYLNLYANANNLTQAEKKAVYDRFMLANFYRPIPAKQAPAKQAPAKKQ